MRGRAVGTWKDVCCDHGSEYALFADDASGPQGTDNRTRIPRRTQQRPPNSPQVFPPSRGVIDIRAPGVLKAWRGIKHEEIQVYVILILWENYIASMNFFTSKQCRVVSDAWYPFLAGRELFTRRHILVHDLKQLEQAISTKAIEVAMTRVKPGRVADYYEALWRVVHKVLSNDPGCDGYYINSVLEDPDWQVNPRGERC